MCTYSSQDRLFDAETSVFLIALTLLAGGGLVHSLGNLAPVLEQYGGYEASTRVLVPVWAAAFLFGTVALCLGVYKSLLNGQLNRGMIVCYLAVLSLYFGTVEWSQAFSVPSLNIVVEMEDLRLGVNAIGLILLLWQWRLWNQVVAGER